MKSDFLELSDWWGLSDRPGAREMNIYLDGKYTWVVQYHRDGSGNREENGIIDAERMTKLKELAEKKVVENKDHMIFDMGNTIKYLKNGEVIKIENDGELWRELMEILPEYKKH